MQRSILAVGLLLTAAMSWGGMFPVAKPALAVMDPFYMTLIRYASVAVILLLIVGLVEGPRSWRTEGHLLKLFLLGSLGFAGFNLLAFTGLEHAEPEHGAVIMALMPMITVLLSWGLKGERPAPFTLAMVVLAFSGVFLVITGGDPSKAFGGGEAQWDLLFLAGATCWVSYTMGGGLFPQWSPVRYTALTCALGSITLAAIALGLTEAGSIQVPTWSEVVDLHTTFAYLIVMGGLVAVLSWNTGIRMVGPVNGVLFINFVPVTAFTIGIAQGKAFGLHEVLGAALVISALIANNLFLRWRSRMAARHMPAMAGACNGS